MDNGLSRMCDGTASNEFRKVLILIVMDNGLSRRGAGLTLRYSSGLNPYCNG